MIDLVLKLPVPEALIQALADQNKISFEAAKDHYEKLFNNIIQLMVPNILKDMEKRIK